MKRCPVCTLEDEAVNVALHLSGHHHWAYRDVQDWLWSNVEEKCEQ